MRTFKLPGKEIYFKFKNVFGIDLSNFKDTIPMMVTGNFSFDIVSFDKFCHQSFGYSEDKDGSLSQFISKKFGKDANQLISFLLQFEGGE